MTLSFFLKLYNKQAWQDGMLACSDLTLQMMLTLPQQDHITNINGLTTELAGNYDATTSLVML